MIRELLTKRDAMSQTIYFINYTKVNLGFWGFECRRMVAACSSMVKQDAAMSSATALFLAQAVDVEAMIEVVAAAKVSMVVF